MKMNKIILTLAAFALTLSSQAQQIPLYSNYFFTPYMYNPARSGTEGYTELSVLHRRQWTGIQGSPETSALGVNGSLNEEKVGWSGYAFSDQTDIIKRIGVYGNYAYHIRLADNTTLSLGLGAGYLANTINTDAIRAQDQGDVYTVINGNRGTFDLNFGFNLKIADFQLGASVPQLVGQPVKYLGDVASDDVTYTLLRHYVINAQYDFKFSGDKNVLSPMVMLRAADNNVPIQVDAGLMFNMKKYGYVGAMFRSEYAVTGNIGLNLTEQLTVGYAYDFSLNDYGPDLGTSHEFMLTYRFGSNKRNERLENEIKKLKQQQRRQKDETEELVDEKLEEFKDDYKRELDEQVKQSAEEAAKAAAEAAAENAAAQQQANQQGNMNGQQGGNMNNQGNASQQGQGGNTTVVVPGQGNNGNAGNNYDNNNYNNGNNNGGVNGGYNSANTASNVTPGSRGFYVVAGVFSNKTNADKLLRKLQGQGLEARSFQDPGNYYHYVYLLKFDNYQQAEQAKGSNLNGSYSGDLWIKILK